MMTNMQTNRPLPDEVVVRLSYHEAFVLSDFSTDGREQGFDQPHQICNKSNTDHGSTARYGNSTAA